jgi:transcriptional regulator with XRE-family HTH domain
MDVREVGRYIRQQRESSRLSLRGLSGLTGVSGTYLSQVERGLRKPSADILQVIAKGLRISAETLYVQAGILEDRPVADVASVIMSDLAINERQKQALVQIYEAFREETSRNGAAAPSERTATQKACPKAAVEPKKERSSRSHPANAPSEAAPRKQTSRSAPPRPKAAGGAQSASRVRARTTKEE